MLLVWLGSNSNSNVCCLSTIVPQSEHLVQEAIDKAVVGRTVLIVAHRLSTIQRADQIVVVDNCSIVDVGKHSELLERCSRYQDLIKRQSMTGQLPADVLASLRVST
jgi:ABC-type multidrug transport system fused ATPase/permease subunit